ncbi:MAG: response regulator [Fibrobacteres bacterium]|nr:response regulator [Fibrobacterota bacterium]
MASAEKKRILLVDDEPGIRRILRLFLEVEGFEVFEAENAETALASVKENRPNLVILDIILYGATGFEVCDAIKNNPATKDTFVMLFTALTKEADIAEGEKVGADMYLMKPMNPREIVERVKKALTC